MRGLFRMAAAGLLAPLAPLGTLAACGGGDGPSDVDPLSDAAVIEYRYGDASVPPEFHRSYTLTITRTDVHVVVDSYGDVIVEATEPLPGEVWDDLVADVGDMAALDAGNGAGGGDGCAGGTSRHLTVRDAGVVVVDLDAEVCGDAGSRAGERIDDYVAPVTEVFPDFEAIVRTDVGDLGHADLVVTYHYGDSSVPPEFHRSYTVTVTRDEVHAVVDSYGDVVAEVTEPLPLAVWNDVVLGIEGVRDLAVADDAGACAGGTSRELLAVEGPQTLVDLSFGVCGDAGSDAAHEVDLVIAPVLDAIPGWSDLVAT
jgi:hypothetical protein